MPVFIQIAGLLEVLSPDPFWFWVLAPLFFNMIGLAYVVGLLRPRGTTNTMEVSVSLAYLGSIAIARPSSCMAPQPSEPAAPHKYASGLSRRTVRDAAE